MAYYDPKTWQSLDASKVFALDNEGGTDYWTSSDPNSLSRLMGADRNSARDYVTADSNPYYRVKSGDLTSDYLSQFSGLGTTSNYMKDLVGKGYGVNDFESAINSYLGAGGRGSRNDMGWWGDQATLRALGTGFDTMGKQTGWNSLYNPTAETQQQKVSADTLMATQDNGGEDWGDVLSGLGFVLGAGALGGAFGGSGLFGGGNFPVGGADWMSEIAAGAGNGGAGLGSAAGAATDAAWGVNPRGGDMDWLDELLNSTGTGYGTPTSGDPLAGLFDTTGAGTPGGQVTGDTGSDWSTGGSNPGSGSVYGPGASGGSTMPNLPPGASSALSRILSGNGTAADYASLAGTAGTGFLSYLSANNYTDAMKQLADRSWNAGQPYRDKLAASYADPNAFLANSPDIQASVNQGTNALARSLSTQGNPTGSGRALQELQNYATNGLYGQLGNARQQLANFGGQSAISGAFPQLGSQSADSSGNVYNSLANTVSRATQPQTDWQSIMKSFGFSNSPV